jgi:ABC-2 type transport system ATP-binding protein
MELPDDAPVISAYHLGKRFVTRRRETSLKEGFVGRFTRRSHIEKDTFVALSDVNLEIGRGQTVGLIGHNGSGKSTLLKTLSGILQPDDGECHILGRVASLLELGAGFNGELSGRDNIYLNAALLGLSRSEIDALYDDIVTFSELGDRLEDPVKVYSSGMYVKLGFAVAVHVDPDVLLVDEVLAVGDEAFQEKCLYRIQEFQRAGKTILFVSHALDQVKKLCDRAIVLDHGKVVYDGAADHAVSLLRGLLGVAPVPKETEAEVVEGFVPVTIDDAVVASMPGLPGQDWFLPGDTVYLTIEGDILPGSDWSGGEVAVVAMAAGDVPVWVMHATGDARLPPTPGHWTQRFFVPAMPAVRGALSLAISVTDIDTGKTLAAKRFTNAFGVQGDPAEGLVEVAYAGLPPEVVPHAVLPERLAETAGDRSR